MPSHNLGDAPFDITQASSSSGLLISYNSSDNSIATISGNTISITGAGTVNIIANQSGNSIYAAAVSITRPLVVSKGLQTITFNSITSKTLGEASFQLTASASSGLIVNYSTTSDKISLVSSNVTLVKAGRVTIRADQAGNNNYNNAASVDQSFCINPVKPTITSIGTKVATQLTSSNDSGNQWYLNDAVITGAVAKTYSASASGSYTVKTTVDDCVSELSEQFALTITGLGEELTVSLYPNPVRDEILLNLGGITQTETSVLMTDMLGRTIDSRNVGDGIHSFDVHSLTSGIYIIRVQGKRGVVTKTFVKTE